MKLFRHIMFLILSLLFCSCATTKDLRISEIQTCLEVDIDIESVSSCIMQSHGYRKVSPKTNCELFLTSLVEFCSDWDLACSHKDLDKRLHQESKERVMAYTNEVHKYSAISEPCYQFLSYKGNLGGSYVRLYVFYDGNSGKVVGWMNRGSAANKHDFRNQKKKRNKEKE